MQRINNITCIHALPHSRCVSDGGCCSEAQSVMAGPFCRSSFIPQAYRLAGPGVRASLSGCVIQVTRYIIRIPQAHRLAGIGVRASLRGCVNTVTRYIIRNGRFKNAQGDPKSRMAWHGARNTPGPGITNSLAIPIGLTVRSSAAVGNVNGLAGTQSGRYPDGVSANNRRRERSSHDT